MSEADLFLRKKLLPFMKGDFRSGKFRRGESKEKDMLQIEHLNISMRKDLRELVRDLTLSLNPGDRMAVIGEEGNGKSTLLKLIYDEALVEGYADWSGTIRKSGMILGYLPQELPPADREKTAYEFCCQEPAFLESTPKEIADIASELGFSQELLYSDRPVGTLSGGEKVKLQAALLTLRRPDCYLLDEPSNDLDIETLEWLERFIQNCPQPVLYISHDETLLENTATAILHLEQLRKKTLPRWTVQKIGYRQYVDERLSKFASQEQMARKEREEERKKLEKFRQIYQRVEHEQNAISRGNPSGGRLLKKKMKSVKALEHRMDREREDMTQMPESEDAILVGFDPAVTLPAGKTVIEFDLPELAVGEKVLAEKIKLFVRGPEHICIIGKNGAGKTTFLRKLAQELLARPDLNAVYMPQDYGETVDERETPVEFLAKSSEKAELTRVKTYLGSMKYTAEECEHSIAELSGGQKAKLFFLKMILDGSNVLILDEPTRNFSPLSGPVIRKILKEFGGCILSVSHDRKYLSEVCETLYELTPEGLFPKETP